MNDVKTGKETASSCGRTLYYHILGLYIYCIYIYGKYLTAPKTLATFARHLVGKIWKKWLSISNLLFNKHQPGMKGNKSG